MVQWMSTTQMRSGTDTMKTPYGAHQKLLLISTAVPTLVSLNTCMYQVSGIRYQVFLFNLGNV